jgi:hypothetical protein
MPTYCEYSGVHIDVAVCTNCDKQEVFETPRELCCVIGSSDGFWKCILKDLDDPSNHEVVCPDCEPESTGWTYILNNS